MKMYKWLKFQSTSIYWAMESEHVLVQQLISLHGSQGIKSFNLLAKQRHHIGNTVYEHMKEVRALSMNSK